MKKQDKETEQMISELIIEREKFKDEKVFVLELLYQKARKWSEREKTMLNAGQNELAQFFAVRRLMSFAIQDIINECESSIKMHCKLDSMRMDLHNDMAFYRDNRISHVADLYAVACVAFDEMESIINRYLR